jgi:hypothetical protein
MSILGCLTVFTCLCGVLTGAIYKVEHGDQSRSSVVKKSKKSYFSRFFSCCCCCGDAPILKPQCSGINIGNITGQNYKIFFRAWALDKSCHKHFY